MTTTNEHIFLNDTSFQLKIEELVAEGHSYLEATVLFCEENDVEYDKIKKILTPNLRDKIKNDAMDSGLMRMESKLPI